MDKEENLTEDNWSIKRMVPFLPPTPATVPLFFISLTETSGDKVPKKPT